MRDESRTLIAKIISASGGESEDNEALREIVQTNFAEILEPSVYQTIADLWTIGEIPSFPWGLFSPIVNTLVISYNFAPFADASAVTVAKRLREFARPVHVVAQDLHTIRSRDPQLERLVSPYAVSIDRVPTPPSFAQWRSIREFVREAMEVLKPALDAGQYSTVYSRSMFPASHFLGAHIKALYPSVWWIAEFSDPIQHNVDGSRRVGGDFELDEWAGFLATRCSPEVQLLLRDQVSVFAWCELLAFGLGDDLWFTNEHQREAMLDPLRGGETQAKAWSKSVVSAHPTFPHSFYHLGKSAIPPKSFKTRIGYFGEFYPNRGLGDLFRALELLPDDVQSSVQILVFTGNIQACRKAVTMHGLEHLVRVFSPLSLLDFFTTATMVDLLVVNDVIPGSSYSKNPYLPSKVSDYLGAETQILAIVWPGSVLSTLSDTNRYLVGDVLGISRFIEKLVRSRSPMNEDPVSG